MDNSWFHMKLFPARRETHWAVMHTAEVWRLSHLALNNAPVRNKDNRQFRFSHLHVLFPVVAASSRNKA